MLQQVITSLSLFFMMTLFSGGISPSTKTATCLLAFNLAAPVEHCTVFPDSSSESLKMIQVT
jgi:hypothetical protein